MKYTVEEKYNCVAIHLKGKVMGGPDAEVFKSELRELIDSGKKQVIFNLKDARFMNSSGLGILIGGLSALKKHDGVLKLCNADKKISSMLMVSQLNTVFDHHFSLQSAIDSFNSELKESPSK